MYYILTDQLLPAERENTENVKLPIWEWGTVNALQKHRHPTSSAFVSARKLMKTFSPQFDIVYVFKGNFILAAARGSSASPLSAGSGDIYPIRVFSVCLKTTNLFHLLCALSRHPLLSDSGDDARGLSPDKLCLKTKHGKLPN